MRLQEHNGPLIPPLYALRRGWGTGLERGLVFLELLRQLGPADELQGCLVYCPDKQGGPLRFWACGVIVDNGKAVYLFDPRLGLALPGPEGKGIATLTQVSKDPTVLAQLNRAASKSEVYDVEPDQAAHAEIQQVCNLSALAPRVRFVEETLQASAGRVRLAVQAEEEAKRLTQASGTNSCRAWRAPGPDGQGEDGPGLVRRFLPTLEGGIDTAEPGGRLWLFRRSLVPLQLLPGRINRIPLDSNLGNGIGWYFTRPFTEAVMTPGKPRDLMLRGQLTTAVRELVNQDEEIRRRQALRQSAGNLDKGIDDFLKEIVPLYADQVRNRTNPAALAQTNREIDEAWQHGEPLLLLLEGATSQVRLAETAYLLALCKQEEAERIQSRLDLLSGARVKISPDEAKQAASAWSAAKDNWEAALRSNPTDAMIPFVRLHSARCLFHLGRKTEAAEEWVKASHELPGLQRVAASYLAARK
jgi:hypothetical protein